MAVSETDSPRIRYRRSTAGYWPPLPPGGFGGAPVADVARGYAYAQGIVAPIRFRDFSMVVPLSFWPVSGPSWHRRRWEGRCGSRRISKPPTAVAGGYFRSPISGHGGDRESEYRSSPTVRGSSTGTAWDAAALAGNRAAAVRCAARKRSTTR